MEFVQFSKEHAIILWFGPYCSILYGGTVILFAGKIRDSIVTKFKISLM